MYGVVGQGSRGSGNWDQGWWGLDINRGGAKGWEGQWVMRFKVQERFLGLKNG